MIRLQTSYIYGCIDEFFDYKYGELGYRSLRFETDVMQRKIIRESQ